MKKVLIGVAALLVLLVAAILIAPGFIDWNRYKGRIADRLETALGREVEIAGDLSLSLLPAPALAVDELRVANVPGGDAADMIHVRSLRLRLAPGELLRGNLRIASLALIEPVVTVETLPDGGGNWQFHNAADGGGPASSAAAGEGGGDGIRIDFDSVTVEDGTLVWRAQGESPITLRDVDAELTGSIGGPFRLDAEATWRGLRLAVDGDVGRIGDSVPLALTARLPEAGAQARLEGYLGGLEQGEPAFDGRLAARGGDLAAVATALGADAPPLAARAFALDGQLQASAETASLDNVALRLGQTEGSGGIGVRFGETPLIDVALAFNSIDLDETTGAGDGGADTAGGDGGAGDEAGFALPTAFEMDLDLRADAVIWRGAVLRQGIVEAALRDGALNVKRISAFGPGGSDLTAFGTVAPVEGVAAFDGGFDTAADNLRAVLSWLDIDVPDVPADRLRRFSASGTVKGTPTSFQVGDLDMTLDTTQLRGAANVQLGARPAFGANIVADNLNIDAYRIREGTPAEGEAAGTGEAAPGAVEGVRFLAAFDANLKARMDKLVVGGRAYEDLQIDGTLLHGDITLRQSSIGSLANAGSVTAEGTVRGLATGAVSFEAFSYTVETEQPARVLSLAGLAAPEGVEDLAPAVLSGTLNGPLDNLEFTSANRLGGGRLALSGRVSGLPGPPAYDVAVEAAHPSFEQVARLFAEDYRPSGSIGAFAFSGRFEGDAEAVTGDDLALTAGDAGLQGKVSISLTGRPHVTASLAGSNLILDPFLPAERRASLPRGPYVPAVLKAEGGEALLLPAQARRAPPPNAPWTREPLNLSWLADFDADVDFKSDLLALGEYRLASPVAKLTLAEGTASLERMTADLFNGSLTLGGHLAHDGAAALRMTLGSARIQEALELAAGVDMVAGTLNARAELATRGESTWDMARNLGGGGSFEVRDGVLRGFDLAAVSASLRQLESVAGVLGLVQGSLFGGRTHFSDIAGSFSAHDGMIVSEDIAVEAEGGSGRINGTIDLPAYHLQATGIFGLADYPQAPPVVVRLDGPLDSPRRSVDVQQLQTYLLAQGIGRLIAPRDRKPAPRDETQPPPPEQQRPPQDFQPEQIMRGLLDMLQQQQRR